VARPSDRMDHTGTDAEQHEETSRIQEGVGVDVNVGVNGTCDRSGSAGAGCHGHDNGDGIWMGIDLGTTNSTCAVWDTTLARPKSLRLDIAAPPPKTSSKRHGKLVPSAILFVERSLLLSLSLQTAEHAHNNILQAVEIDFEHISITSTRHGSKNKTSMPPPDIVALVGQPALDILEQALKRDEENKKMQASVVSSDGEQVSSSNDGSRNDNNNNDRTKANTATTTSPLSSFWGNLFRSNPSNPPGNAAGDNSQVDNNNTQQIDALHSFTANDVNAALVVSFKRLLGKQVGDCTTEFLQTLPYQTTTAGGKGDNHENNGDLVDGDDLWIQVRPLTMTSASSSRSTNAMDHGATQEQKSEKDDDDEDHPQGEGDGDDSSILLDVLPSELTRICLQASKESAERSLSSFRNKIHPPIGNATNRGTVSNSEGSDATNQQQPESTSTTGIHAIQNVVVGVPANYSRAQREIVEKAARLAGFSGSSSYVKTLSESTAAIMAYGLFTSSRAHDQVVPTSTSADETSTSTTTAGSNSKILTALVFDMGGGTTDVTIASMTRGGTNANDNDDDAWTYRVLATEGDLTLGGDDIDEILVQWLLSKVKVASATCADTPSDQSKSPTDELLSSSGSSRHQRGLHKACCRAKELLCGNLNKDVEPQESVVVEYGGHRQKLSTTEFESLIQNAIVERCAKVVDNAMASCNSVIDEVVLVGGGSRIPAIRTMLQGKLFPSSSPSSSSIGNDDGAGASSLHSKDENKDDNLNMLCTSLNANAAVAHGTAIFGTMESGLVPRHELLSALMLDALPHAIGVLVPSTSSDDAAGGADDSDRFIEVLAKDVSLPASSYKTFDLSSMDQKGITIPVVELVGTSRISGPMYEKVGDFSFLLHKLSVEQKERLSLAKKQSMTRAVDVGIAVDLDGKITVSFFDWNDPEHLQKRRQYLERHGGKVSTAEEDGDDDDDGAAAEAEAQAILNLSSDKETTLLVVACFFMLALYIAVKIMFATDPTGGSDGDEVHYLNNDQETDEL
jgi:molecular chaperone DnaK (HSP70)